MIKTLAMMHAADLVLINNNNNNKKKYLHSLLLLLLFVEENYNLKLKNIIIIVDHYIFFCSQNIIEL